MTTHAPHLQPHITCDTPLFPDGLVQSAFDTALEHGTVEGKGIQAKHTIQMKGSGDVTITIWSEGPQSPERRTCIIIDGTYKRKPFHASVVYAYGLRGQSIGIESVEVTLDGQTDKVAQPADKRERNDQEEEFRNVAGDETEAALSAMLTYALPIIAAEHARLDEQIILDRAKNLIVAQRGVDVSQSIVRGWAGKALSAVGLGKKTGHDMKPDPLDPPKLIGLNAAHLGRISGKAAISRDRKPMRRVELPVNTDLMVYIDEPLDTPQGQNHPLTVTVNDATGRLIATLVYNYPYLLAQMPTLESIGMYDGNVWREGRKEGKMTPWMTLSFHAGLDNMQSIEATVLRIDAAIQTQLEQMTTPTGTTPPLRSRAATAETAAEEATPPAEEPAAETAAPETTTAPVSDEEAARLAAFLRGEGDL